MSKTKHFISIFFTFISLFAIQADPIKEIQPNYEFIGYHMMASYLYCDPKALTDLGGLNKAMHQAVQASGATLLQTVEHVFPPNGFSMIMLLSESHASIHTYPEYNACFVDFFTCGRHCSSEKFDEVLRDYLHPAEASSRLFLRQEGHSIDVTTQKK